MSGDFQWKEEYNLGVPHLDKAHEEVFSKVRHLMAVLSMNDYDESRRVCNEILVSLEKNVLDHFHEEEIYMIENEYRGYHSHKATHDHFLNVMLPSCKIELETSNFSERALREFTSTILGWLISHVLIDDKAITNRSINKWNIDSSVDPVILLTAELNKFMKLLCGLDVSLLSSSLKGVPIADGYFTEFSYDDGTEIIVGASKRIVSEMAAPLLGRHDAVFDNLTEHAYKQIAISLVNAVLITTSPEKEFSFLSQRTLDSYSFTQMFAKNKWNYALLWESELGQQLLCVSFPDW